MSKEIFDTICSLGISRSKPTRRGKKGGRKQSLKQNDNSIGRTPPTGTFDHDVSLFSLNCQVAKQKSKTGIITDLLVEHQIQIFCLTET